MFYSFHSESATNHQSYALAIRREGEKMIPTQAKKIVAVPAIYTFSTLRSLTDSDIKEQKLPEKIRNWGWHSITELRDGAEARLRHKYVHTQHVLSRINSSDFTILNNPPDEFSWFILLGEGILQIGRPPKACPFGDDQLFVPSLWGNRVLEATAEGFIAVERWQEGNGIGLNGVFPDGSKKRADYLAHS